MSTSRRLGAFFLGYLCFCLTHSTGAALASSPVLVAVSMKSEAELFPGPRYVTVVGAKQPRLLRSRLQAYAGRDVKAVVSFGLAGALDPKLAPGQLIIGTKVVDERGSWTMSASLVSNFERALRDLHPIKAIVASVQNCSGLDPEARANLRASLDADVVDCESDPAVRFAQKKHVPFVVIHAVADTADVTLPPAALIPLLPDGSLDMDSISSSLRAHPFQMVTLMKLGSDFGAAKRTLSAAAQLLSNLSFASAQEHEAAEEGVK